MVMPAPSSADARRLLADYLAPHVREQKQKAKPLSIGEFARRHFYIPETQNTLTLLPHQAVILDYAFDPERDFTTIVYSTVKKSGKTAIAALAARWVTETWGARNEVFCLANDLEQARGRIYQKAIDSIELDPTYDMGKRLLPGQWRIINRDATHLPSRSILRAVSSDYKGEAGSNPTATFWSELWAYSSEATHRLWDELTPVPTRARSIRYVETYAGYENESDLLLDLYAKAMKGRRLTHDDIDWPFDDQPPIYINEAARLFAYWDQGPIARRMPWQTPAYYAEQQESLREPAFRRLHLNEWTSSVDQFLPVEWWEGCRDTAMPQARPLTSADPTPLVLAVDGAVTSDCAAIVAVARMPDDPRAVPETDSEGRPVPLKPHLYFPFYYKFTPPPGGSINLNDVENLIRRICSEYLVYQMAYDPYQLADMAQTLTRDGVVWCKSFDQGRQREVSDKTLYDVIRDRRIHHRAAEDFTEHITNSAAKLTKDQDSKMRIVKKGTGKIDLVVAASMGVYEALRLNM